MTTRTRCGCPVIGFTIGPVLPSARPGTAKWPTRAAMSAENAMGLNCGGCTVAKVLANTLKMVAPGAVSSPDEDGQKCRALSLVGALVDHRQALAIALVDRAGPGDQADPVQAGERHVAEMPLVDPHRHGRPAVAVGRQGIELAGAAEVAVAGAELRTFDSPVDIGHLSTSGQLVAITPYGPYATRVRKP